MSISISPVQERAIELLLAGSTVAAAARELGIDRTTIYNWRKTRPFFTVALHQARKIHAEYLADSLRDLASTAVDTLRELLLSKDVPAAIRLRAAQAVLTKTPQPAVPAIEPQAGVNHAAIEALIGPPIPHNSTEFDTFAEVDPPKAAADPSTSTTTQTIRRESAKVGRNELCPCGSTLKYKRCCGSPQLQARTA